MQIATQRGQLQLAATFLITVTLGSLLPQATLGQDAQTPEQKDASGQIDGLVADLAQRGAVLEQLSRKVGENPDGAAAAMLDKEISDRRARYRRDVAKLVQLVVGAEDAGTKAAQGRAMATKFLQEDARTMRKKLEETGRETVALVDAATKGSPDEAHKTRNELSRKLSTSSRLIKYLDTNIDQQKMLGLDVKADIE